MTTSQSTTFSPSSRSTTRSTPCVLGCCGPMFSTSSLVSNIAPLTVCVSMSRSCYVRRAACIVLRYDERRTTNDERPLLYICFVPRLPQLQPVERVFHQQFAGALERIILPLRKSLPVVRHQNPTA